MNVWEWRRMVTQLATRFGVTVDFGTGFQSPGVTVTGDPTCCRSFAAALDRMAGG